MRFFNPRAFILVLGLIAGRRVRAQEVDPQLHFSQPSSTAERALSHKVLARYAGGVLSNVGTVKGSGFTYYSASFGGLYYFLEQVAVGAAYKIEISDGSIPVKGFDVFSRYYFLGSGTKVRVKNSIGDLIEQHRLWSPYLGMEFSNRSYDVLVNPSASDPNDRTIKGSVSAVNVAAGLDYRLASNLEATAEYNMTVMPFAGSDPRVKLKWMIVQIGANYVF